MVENSLYHDYREENPDRFRVGIRRNPVKDHLGRLQRDPCFGCIVDTSIEASCKKCRNEDKANVPKQTTLGF